ncbi:MAG: CRTAC1 family protein, partial [Rhodothermales bacterium]
FDADRDGHLDLYAGNYVAWSPETDIFCSLDRETKGYCTPETYQGVPARFYHNNGDGTFTDQTEANGFGEAPGKTLGVAELDFNRDGWPDLAVSSDTQRDLLYENNGDGTFTERGAISGVAYDENGKARAGMGIDVGVLDSTGQETIVVGNFSKEMIGVYRHMGDGLFIDRAAVSQVGRPSLLTLTFGLFLFDVDLDGDLDLFAANGHVQPEIEATQEGVGYAEVPHLFINGGDGLFEDVAPAIGGPLAERVVARGAAYADYDRDGDLDVLITENNGPAHLWRNDLTNAHFLRVSTAGQESNRDGIGTRLVVKVDGRPMERRIRTGGSYLAQSEQTATFGLGDHERADSLLVYWPSGQVDRFADVEANQHVRVVEGTGTLEPVRTSEPEPVASR